MLRPISCKKCCEPLVWFEDTTNILHLAGLAANIKVFGALLICPNTDCKATTKFDGSTGDRRRQRQKRVAEERERTAIATG
ncbi:MAG: hypothetical protein ACRD43_05200 [Pyrinomonadaceae bacterium]